MRVPGSRRLIDEVDRWISAAVRVMRVEKMDNIEHLPQQGYRLKKK